MWSLYFPKQLELNGVLTFWLTRCWLLSSASNRSSLSFCAQAADLVIVMFVPPIKWSDRGSKINISDENHYFFAK